MAALEESVEIVEETEEDLPEESTEESQESDITTPEETTPGASSDDVSEGDASPSAPREDISSGDANDVTDGDVTEGDVSSGDVSPVTSSPTSISLSDNPEIEELLTSILETEQLQLESSVKIETQNQAVISILLIIITVGLLHYIYRFLKLFF